MRDFRLLYVSGASGSGTTLLAQILAAAPQVVTVAGKHRTLSREKDPAFRLAKRINWTTRDLWDRHGDVSLYAQARQALPRLVQELLQYEQHAATTHLVIKRSSPFYRGDRYRPDMQDIVDLFPNSRILSFTAIHARRHTRRSAGDLRRTCITWPWFARNISHCYRRSFKHWMPGHIWHFATRHGCSTPKR
ncbi:MAG: hypothetical protein HND48_21435 [Chloroflexi bacterium]|nr:hypothetical protein [Chloroflexota bacterium]